MDVLDILCTSSQGLPGMGLGAKVLNYSTVNGHLLKFLYIIYDSLQDLKASYF